MSKMDEQFEQRLEENKYQMWEILVDISASYPRDRWGQADIHRHTLIKKAEQFIKMIEGE